MKKITEKIIQDTKQIALNDDKVDRDVEGNFISTNQTLSQLKPKTVRSKPITKSSRAGLVFPVGKMHRLLKHHVGYSYIITL